MTGQQLLLLIIFHFIMTMSTSSSWNAILSLSNLHIVIRVYRYIFKVKPNHGCIQPQVYGSRRWSSLLSSSAGNMTFTVMFTRMTTTCPRFVIPSFKDSSTFVFFVCQEPLFACMTLRSIHSVCVFWWQDLNTVIEVAIPVVILFMNHIMMMVFLGCNWSTCWAPESTRLKETTWQTMKKKRPHSCQEWSREWKEAPLSCIACLVSLIASFSKENLSSNRTFAYCFCILDTESTNSFSSSSSLT